MKAVLDWAAFLYFILVADVFCWFVILEKWGIF